MLDKWFALQAAAQRSDTVDQVLKLAAHPDFMITNPNRLRSLAGTFGANHWAFHSRDGRGYAFLADMIIAADKLNPQVAARLVPPFGRWRRFEPKRAEMMRQALERIVATPGLSKDVFEQVIEKPRLEALAADPLATSSATWLAAWFSAGPMLAAVPSAAALAVKRRASTWLPPSVDSDAS